MNQLVIVRPNMSLSDQTCQCLSRKKHVSYSRLNIIVIPDKICHCYSRSSMPLLFQTKYILVISGQACHCYSRSNISFQVRRHCHYRPNMSFHVIHVVIIPDQICHSMSN